MPDDAATAGEQGAVPGDDAPADEAAPLDEPQSEQGSAPAADAAESDQAAPSGGIPSDVAQAVGEGAELLVPFARQAGELLTVGLEGAVAAAAQVRDVGVSITDYEALEREFSELDHVAFELRVAINETEAYLVAALVPLEDVGTLFTIDASAEQMGDDEFAKAQLDTVAAGARELLDLMSLTLFAGELSGAEVTLSDLRRGQIELTMGALADAAQGAPPVRIEFSLVLADDGVARAVLAVPAALLSRLAGLLSDRQTEAVSDAGPADEAPPGEPAPGGEAANVTPLRAEVGRGSGHRDADDEGGGAPEVAVHPVRFPPLSDAGGTGNAPRSIDLLMDVSMRVTVELGRSTMAVEDILALAPGSVVELNKLAGEPVDILVNDRLIAHGEVVVVDENFGVRVTEIISSRNRAQATGR